MDKPKSVLIVSYYWPPAGGAGVQRWLLTTKYLVEEGWNVHLYCPENPSYPLVDESLKEQINREIHVVKKPIWEPFSLAQRFFSKTKSYQKGAFETKNSQTWLGKLMVFIRGNFFIPDARVFWRRPSVRFLSTYTKQHGINTIITTGPPHSMHLIGLGLKEKNAEIKWVADFRDPWTTISYHAALRLTKWAERRHKRLELRVLQNASAVVATSFSDRDEFLALGAKSCITITNGFDSEIYEEIQRKNGKFRITYVGGLELARNPEPLWNALVKWKEVNPKLEGELELHFYGSLSDEVRLELEKHALLKLIKEHGYVPHSNAKQAMRDSDLLWLSNFNREESKGIVPGKLFEYLAAARPILSVGPADADVERILTECDAGKHFLYDEPTKVLSFLKNEFEKNREGKMTKPNRKAIQTYHRQALAKKWSALLLQLSKE